MDEGGAASFSVVYFNGQTEVNVGEVTVDSSFNFNKFLSCLNQKIGISSHKVSVYLAKFGTKKRIPITEKVNFAAIARENDAASFLFVEKSKRSKSRKNKLRNKGVPPRNCNNATKPENVVLLRRNDKVLGWAQWHKWVRDLQLERERFFMSMSMRQGGADGGGIICKKCLSGSDGGFHWCVNDAVTLGFRSSAGPVARPVKGSG